MTNAECNDEANGPRLDRLTNEWRHHPNHRGYTAEGRVGSSPTRPFVVISKEQTTKARTTFGLRPRSGRYLMLWITSMPEEGAAAVNEITVTAN